MPIRTSHRLATLLGLILLAGLAAAQTIQEPSGNPIIPTDTLDQPRALRAPAELPDRFDAAESLLPPLDKRALAWIAAVMTLALVARVRPLGTMRNVDALVLSGSCLLLLLRDHLGFFDGTPDGPDVRWYAYLAVSIVAGYWLIRGIMLLVSRAPRPIHANMAEGGLAVLAIAGLALGITTIVNAPLSDGARDGLLGGLVVAETGHLPYGDVDDADSRSPLLYGVFAGANQIVPAQLDRDQPMTWANRIAWRNTHWEDYFEMGTVRVVNAGLFVLLWVGILVAGRRLHSKHLGLTLGILLCFYPGFVECFHQPDLTLPAVLLTWTIVFATIPGIGGLLAMLTVIAAGLSWGWAFLLVPVLLGYFFGQRWNGFGAALGLIVGLAGITTGLLYLVAPSLPRPDGAMRLAGWQPAYTAEEAEDGTLVIAAINEDLGVEGDWQSRMWLYLLNDTTSLADTDLAPALPDGKAAGGVLFARLSVDEPTRPQVREGYRTAVAKKDSLARLKASTRTLLESTWKPQDTAPIAPHRPGAWALWESGSDLPAERWTLIRRGIKVVVGLLAIVFGVALFRMRGAEPHQLLGGLLAVAAATLLVSTTGAVSDLVLIAPFVLACLCAGGRPDADDPATGPRITFNN